MGTNSEFKPITRDDKSKQNQTDFGIHTNNLSRRDNRRSSLEVFERWKGGGGGLLLFRTIAWRDESRENH